MCSADSLTGFCGRCAPFEHRPVEPRPHSRENTAEADTGVRPLRNERCRQTARRKIAAEQRARWARVKMGSGRLRYRPLIRDSNFRVADNPEVGRLGRRYERGRKGGPLHNSHFRLVPPCRESAREVVALLPRAHVESAVPPEQESCSRRLLDADRRSASPLRIRCGYLLARVDGPARRRRGAARISRLR